MADDLDATQNGLVSAVGGVVEVATGIHTGSVRVTVETHSQLPDPALGWEEIAEMPCHSPSGEVLVTLMMDDPADLPSLPSQGPGPYRLRVHALGRDTAVDESTDDVVESYLIQSWPAAHQDALLVKATDAYGPRYEPERPVTPSSSTTRTHSTPRPAGNATSCAGPDTATTPTDLLGLLSGVTSCDPCGMPVGCGMRRVEVLLLSGRLSVRGSGWRPGSDSPGVRSPR
ncbi:hypothetical protein [Streptomyces sp. NPDC005423]|uniref:hypothetical protein n=1 Tax=Streptomyces sp. NPDC005423 TaxID=3155343 RepID=UPI0033A3DD9A